MNSDSQILSRTDRDRARGFERDTIALLRRALAEGLDLVVHADVDGARAERRRGVDVVERVAWQRAQRSLSGRVRLARTADTVRELRAGVALDDRVPVMAAIVRELLTDAIRPRALDLDIAVREACDKRHPPEPRHREIARGFCEELKL